MGLRALNNPKSSFEDPYSSTGKEAVTPAPVPEGFTATGGDVHSYKSGSDYYRVHTFRSSGSFVISDDVVGAVPGNLEYLVVGGGGSGHGGGPANNDGQGGGGGAGGLRTNVPGVTNAAGTSLTNAAVTGVKGTFPVTIGAGGAGGYPGNPGGNSTLALPSSIVATGGGRAGAYVDGLSLIHI